MKLRSFPAILVVAALALTRADMLGQERGPILGATDSALQADGPLSGLWSAELQLDSVWGEERSTSSRIIRGEILMRPVPHLAPGTAVSRSVHPGLFDLNFRPFGFSLSSRDALGWYVGDQTVRMRLHPVVGGGSVELHGVLAGDAITGSWRREFEGRGAAGRFVLRRGTTGR